jgi:lysophospholipase
MAPRVGHDGRTSRKVDMTEKKKLQAQVKKLKAKVSKLQDELRRADAKTARWKAAARQSDDTIASLEKRVAKRDKQLARAKQPAASEPEAPSLARPLSSDEDLPPTSEVAPDSTGAGPDPSWTVAELRAEARSRGLSGMSRKTKAELLDALA